MYDLWAGVCIATETHLRKPELDMLQISNYHILADNCRTTPIGERIGGGVLILVHNTLSAVKGDEIQGLEPWVEHCAITLHLSHQESKSIRLSGIYIPPTGTPATKRKGLETILAADREKGTEEHPSHILAGDLNVTVWFAAYT